jgi:PAS domain S-box-containing protein
VTAGRLRHEARQLLARSLRPPIRDRRFWLIQVLVILIAALNWMAELASARPLDLPPFEPMALFVVPVVYAALNFGLAGSLATAAWVALLSLPSIAVAGDRGEAWGTVTVVALLACVAGFVGQRVEREVLARTEAEAARGELRASEARLRSLFENSPAPTLLVRSGIVRGANPAAAALFGRLRTDLTGTSLAELVGTEAAAAISAGDRPVFELTDAEGSRRFLRPVVSSQVEAGAEPRSTVLQVVFLDVSEERRRLGIKDAYAAYVVKAQEEERARIAQELHDEPLQSIIHLYRLLDRLAADPPPPDVIGQDLEEARDVAESVAVEVRRLAQGLRPASLEDLGLVAGLQRLVNDLGARTTLHTSLEVEGEPRRLDPTTEVGLFRIAQEGLRNAERHARASRVEVRLAFGTEAVTLTVEDDGRGLPEAVSVTPSGEPGSLGLIGMQERAGLLGGHLEISSTPGRGTRIRAQVPAVPPQDPRLARRASRSPAAGARRPRPGAGARAR